MNTNISYNSINNIRTKLLLFIDKEIRANNIKNLKLIPKINSCIQFEETFSQNNLDEIHFSFCQDHQNIINTCEPPKKHIKNHQKNIPNKNIIPKFKISQDSKNKVIHCSFYPKKEIEKNNTTNLELNHEYENNNYNLSSNLILGLKRKVVKKTKKISEVIKFPKKSEKGEQYLKKLCNNLKIMKLKENRKKSKFCFCTNLSKSKSKLRRFASFHFIIHNEKNKRKGAPTSKHSNDINDFKTKIKKIKPFHRKSSIKDN